MPDTKFVSYTGDQRVDALISTDAWAGTTITYRFPTSATDYTSGTWESITNFQAFNAAQKAAVLEAFAMIESYTGLTFTLQAAGDSHLRFAEATNTTLNYYGTTYDYAVSTAFAFYPTTLEFGGDSFFNPNDYNDPTVGDYAYLTVLHELGHALGLKHGHETDGAGAVPYEYDSLEYTVMTYRSYEGAPLTGYTNVDYPQTYMMLDIAALQEMYGANYDTASGNTLYTFDPNDDVIFETIWDGGGTDTYDFSLYSADLDITLEAGGVSGKGSGQEGDLNYFGDQEADGTIFNALMHDGDTRSLIENAKGGSGDDTITGNEVANRLEGNGGNDILSGGGGDDRLYGGAGNDDLDAGEGAGGWQYLLGEGGNDDYFVSAEDGKLFILSNYEGANQGTADAVRFDDLLFADLEASFVTYGGNLSYLGEVLRLQWDKGGEIGELRIGQEGKYIESFVFADGTTKTWQDFQTGAINGTDAGETLLGTVGSDVINGLGGDDSLRGFGGDDVLDAGTGAGGWQYLAGHGGNDTYRIGADNGRVFIANQTENAGQGNADEVVFTDLLLSDLTASFVEYSGNLSGYGTVLRIQWDKNGESGELRIGQEGRYIETFRFADGTTANWTDFQINTIDGTAGSDFLIGTALNDDLNGFSGDDQLRGGAGDDTLDAGAGAGGWQHLGGQSGDDIYEIAADNGRVFIGNNFEGAGEGDDRVIFEDLLFSDISASLITYTGNLSQFGDVLRLQWNKNGETGELRIGEEGQYIEAFEFADGTVVQFDDFVV